MWVELNDAEIGKIVDAVGQGPIADKLSTRPHRFTGAYTAAAESKASEMKENLIVEKSGITERGDFGAYVMAWLWVTDKEADVATNFENRYVSNEIRELADQLPCFRIVESKSDNDHIRYGGEMGAYKWHFETKGSVWMLSALDEVTGRGGWFHIEEWQPGVAANSMNDEGVFSSIVKSLHRLAANPSMTSTTFHPLTWRKYLALYAFGVLKREAAAHLLNVTIELLDNEAAPLIEVIERSRREGTSASFAGPAVNLMSNRNWH